MKTITVEITYDDPADPDAFGCVFSSALISNALARAFPYSRSSGWTVTEIDFAAAAICQASRSTMRQGLPVKRTPPDAPDTAVHFVRDPQYNSTLSVMVGTTCVGYVTTAEIFAAYDWARGVK